MSNDKLYKDALDYHSKRRPGKIEVVPTKPTQTKRDLSLAYSPGVAAPCLEIAKNVEDVYKYTAKGNLVAVISNGTAVLGLGNIGPEASKPVMEGKGLLFKIYADIEQNMNKFIYHKRAKKLPYDCTENITINSELSGDNIEQTKEVISHTHPQYFNKISFKKVKIN